ncbi:MAG: DUF222 domain-containing protein [Acidobacteriota bacterium]|nr:DUF222 domain-containing protein [Acidobacteriota bacterium]
MAPEAPPAVTTTRTRPEETAERHTDLAHLTPRERLGEQITTLAARIDAATYELLVLIRTFDEQEGWKNGFASCAHWLSWRTGLAPNAARERARTVRALAELPLISDAMKRGQLSYSKVRALTRVARPDTEKSLVDLGRAAAAAQVERAVRAWRRIDRTVEAREDELRDAASTVSTHIDENGMLVIRGRLTPEAGEVLRKALEAAGEKLFDKNADDRPPVGKQRADALALVAESALAGDLAPAHGGDRYQVVVHVNEDELRSSEPARVSAETCKGCASTETPPADPRPHGAWLGDSHIRVSAETARRLACEAATVRMVRRNGEILSVGRKTRTIPPPIRRALEFRDQGCRFPGCTLKHRDAHHIEHWADGGETKLSNLVLLCRRHHRLLHEGGCGVRMDAQGEAQFLDRAGRPLERSPAPPPIGLRAARDLVRHLEDAGILITGKESMPAWDGEPMDLRYVMDCLWRPPPHLETVVAREWTTGQAAYERTRGGSGLSIGRLNRSSEAF